MTDRLTDCQTFVDDDTQESGGGERTESANGSSEVRDRRLTFYRETPPLRLLLTLPGTVYAHCCPLVSQSLSRIFDKDGCAAPHFPAYDHHRIISCRLVFIYSSLYFNNFVI